MLLEKRGDNVVGIHRVFYNAKLRPNLFVDDQRHFFLNHAMKAIETAARYQAKYIVFDDLKFRRLNFHSLVQLDDEIRRAAKIFAKVFSSLGEYAKKWGIIIFIQAAPKEIGNSFLITDAEASMMVHTINHENVRLSTRDSTLMMLTRSSQHMHVTQEFYEQNKEVLIGLSNSDELFIALLVPSEQLNSLDTGSIIQAHHPS